MAEITVILNKHGFAVTTPSAPFLYHLIGAEDRSDRIDSRAAAAYYHYRFMHEPIYDPKLGRCR